VSEPDTCPPPIEQVGAPNAGTVIAVQDAAVELNPEPVKVNTVLIVQKAGVTTMVGG